MDELKPEGIRGLLLGPMSLLLELMGGLIPGVLFLLLLVEKHVPEVLTVLNLDIFGYKTRVACGLLLSFVVGRMFLAPVSLIQQRFIKVKPEDFQVPIDPSKTGSMWDRLNPKLKKVAEGALVAGFLRGSTALELFTVVNAELTFRFSMAFVLMTAAAIPGDGRLRVIELLGGLYFLVFGFVLAKKFSEFALSMVGMAAIDLLFRSTEEQRQLAFPFLTTLFVVPEVTPGPAVGVVEGKVALQTKTVAEFGKPNSEN